MLQLLLSESAIETLAETMLHFLWQGVALWLASVAVLHVCPVRTPQGRYAFCAALLLALALAPPLTWAVIAPKSTEAISSHARAGSRFNDSLDEVTLPAHSSLGDLPVAIEAAKSPTESAKIWFANNRASIVGVWLACVVFMTARLVLGGIGVWAIVRRRQPIPLEVARVVDRLARKLAFDVCPAVHAVERISQAMAVGIIRPMVLLPAAWICELPPDVLEAVIAHELAHLRRYDVAINLAQRVVEAVLFFHPVVWWCSRRLRVEREMCCDELAQAAVGNRIAYARALAFLAHQRGSSAEPLLAAGIGGRKMVLLERIRNILHLNSATNSRFYGASCTLIGAAVTSLAWITIFGVPGKPNSSASAVPFDEDGEVSVASPIRGAVPSEKAKAMLPNYTIEPPDVLLIDVLKVVPKPPNRIESTDVLEIRVEGTSDAAPITGQFNVDPSGRIELGPRYGKIQVGGLTIDEATEALKSHLKEIVRNPEVSITLFQSAGLQPVAGEHMVSPDGSVNLGVYGSVKVAGLTLDDAKTAVEEQLSKFLDHPRASVTVFAYNSKVYYVITEGRSGDQVARLPITGSETVLDAIAQVNGLSRLASKKIWIARPGSGAAGHDTILPVNWTEITKGTSTATNYQVFPGDRIFVTDQATAGTKRS